MFLTALAAHLFLPSSSPTIVYFSTLSFYSSNTMLTITFVLSALSMLAAASPAPLEQRGLRISLSKRDGINPSDGTFKGSQDMLDRTIRYVLCSPPAHYTFH